MRTFAGLKSIHSWVVSVGITAVIAASTHCGPPPGAFARRDATTDGTVSTDVVSGDSQPGNDVVNPPSDGTIMCPPGTPTLCGDGCFNTQNDPLHCGSCSNVCTTGQSCINGSCNDGCALPRLTCNGNCIDPATDNNNCGDCGIRCASNQTCESGTCRLACVAPTMACNGLCVNTTSDNNNCGDCGIRCTGGQACVDSVCRSTCNAPNLMCSTRCINPLTDPTNCGNCGITCPSGMCSNGTCVPACNSPMLLCSGQCIDPLTSNTHCGLCNRTCTGTQTCQSGTCVSTPTCNTVRTITANGTFMANSSTQTDMHMQSCGAGGGGASEVIFAIRPTRTTTVTVTTCGSTRSGSTANFDTVMYASQACGGTDLGCDDDGADCGTAGTANPMEAKSQLVLPVTAGQTYFITVDGYTPADVGTVVLHVSGL